MHLVLLLGVSRPLIIGRNAEIWYDVPPHMQDTCLLHLTAHTWFRMLSYPAYTASYMRQSRLLEMGDQLVTPRCSVQTSHGGVVVSCQVCSYFLVLCLRSSDVCIGSVKQRIVPEWPLDSRIFCDSHAWRHPTATVVTKCVHPTEMCVVFVSLARRVHMRSS